MSIAKYEAFLRIVETGSLSAAAEALGYTQSGVSHMLLSLEKELGLRLITRSRAGIHLTAAGETLLPAVRALLSSNERLTQVIAALHGMDAGVVRIGAFTSVAVHWLPGIIKVFQTEYPKIEFQLMNGDYHDVEHWLHNHEVDLGFVRLPFDASYRCTPLFEDRLLAILPPDHRFASAERFPIRQAAREPFISLPESSAQDTRAVLDAAGVTPHIKFYTRDDYAIIAMVANGLGMSIVPELLLSGRTEKIAIKELDTPSSRTIGLALRSADAIGPAAQKFADHVCQWVHHHVDSALCSSSFDWDGNFSLQKAK